MSLRTRIGWGFHARSMRAQRRRIVCAAAGAVTFVAPLAALGVDSNWLLNANGVWGSAGNWSAGTPNGVGDAARFLSAITTNVTVTQNLASVTVGTIELNDNNNYTIGGTNPITMDVASGSATITVNTSNGTGTHTISANLTLNDPLLVTTNSTSSFTLSGAISGGTISKSGGGTVVISGTSANTFTGALIVNAGVLSLSKSPGVNAIGTGGVTAGAGTAIIRLITSNQIEDSAPVTVTSGSFDLQSFSDTIGSLTMTAGTVVGTSTLQVAGNVTSIANAVIASISTNGLDLAAGTRTFNIGDGTTPFDLDVSSVILNGGVTKTGTGTLRMSGNFDNTYIGTTTVSTGTLHLAKTGGVRSIQGDLVIGDGVGGTDADVVRLAASSQIASGVNVSINSSGLLDLAGFTQDITGLTMTGGNLTTGGGLFTVSGSIAANTNPTRAVITGDVNLNGFITPITVAAGADTVDMEIAGAISNGAVTKAGAGELAFTGSTNNTYTGATVAADGILLLSKNANTLAVAGSLQAGDSAGAANSAVVRLTNSNQIVNTSTVTVNSDGLFDLNNFSETIGGITMTGGSITTGTATLSITNDVTVTGTSAATISGVLSLGATRTFTIGAGAPAVELDISASVQTGGMTVAGAGVMRLSGTVSNSTPAGITVNSGTLLLNKTPGINAVSTNLTIGDDIGVLTDIVRLEASNQIAAAPSTTVTVTSSGVLDLNGFSELIGQLIMTGGLVSTGAGEISFLNNDISVNTGTTSSAIITGRIDLLSSNKTFTVDGAAAIDLDVPAVIEATVGFSFIKAGAGAMRISGVNTFSGGVSLDAGSLLIGNNSALGSGALTLNGGTIQADGGPRTISNAVTINAGSVIDGADNLTFSGSVSGSGGLTKQGGGTLGISAATTVTGAWLLSAGTLNGVNLTFGPGGSFTQNGGTFTGILTNQGTFTYNGGSFTGSFINQGVINYGGAFTISSGLTNQATVSIPIAHQLSVGGTGVDNQGTFEMSGGTLAANTIVNNGSLTGFGTLAATAGLTNAASITVTGGTLNLNSLGGQTNNGTIDVETGRQLKLSSGLTNNGAINLSAATVTGPATLTNSATGSVIGRGTISTGITNSGLMMPQGGTLVTPGFTNSGTILLGGAPAALSGGTITNNSIIRGDGTISNNVTNGSTGEIRAESGKTLVLTGVNGTNSGTINLLGGTAQFNQALTIGASGQITGRGTLIGNAGMTNLGQIQLSAGFTDVYGMLTSNSGSKVIVTGGATATFYDDVDCNTGSEFRVTAGSRATFFGNVTGTSFFTGAGIKDFEAGSSSLGDVFTPGSTLVETNASVIANAFRENALTVNGLVTINPSTSGGQTSVVNTLQMSGGTLDLDDNDLIVRSMSYSAVEPLVISGFGNFDWLGTGITSSTAATFAQVDGSRAVGVIDNVDWGHGTFGGQTVSSTDILVKFTWVADANLDGLVDNDDFGQFLFGFSGSGPARWLNGDFDYNGVVDNDDFGWFLTGLSAFQASGNMQLSEDFKSQLTEFATANGIPFVLPEPALLSPLAATALLMRRRRRRAASHA